MVDGILKVALVLRGVMSVSGCRCPMGIARRMDQSSCTKAVPSFSTILSNCCIVREAKIVPFIVLALVLCDVSSDCRGDAGEFERELQCLSGT